MTLLGRRPYKSASRMWMRPRVKSAAEPEGLEETGSVEPPNYDGPNSVSVTGGESLEERKERREAKKDAFTRWTTSVTLGLSVVVAIFTTVNANLSMSAAKEQAQNGVRASEKQADEDFKREQQRDAYADFISAFNVSDSAESIAALKMSNFLRGDDSVNPDELFDGLGPNLNAAYNARDLLTFIAPEDTLAAGHRLVELLVKEDSAVVEVIDAARSNSLQYSHIDVMWKRLISNPIYDVRDQFIALGKRDLAAYDG